MGRPPPPLFGQCPKENVFFSIDPFPYSWEYLFPILLRLQLLRLLSRACSDPEVRGESLLHEAPMVKIPLVQVFTFLPLDLIKSPPRCLLLLRNKNIQNLLNCCSLFQCKGVSPLQIGSHHSCRCFTIRSFTKAHHIFLHNKVDTNQVKT